MLSFFRVLSDWMLPTADDFNGRVSDGGYFHNCANCITRMLYIVFDVHTVGVWCKDQVCNMSVRCYECRDCSDSCKLALPHF